MASNGTVDTTDDVEANENTGLLDISPGTSSQESSFFDDDEMFRPWPATFERSISLLASPMINAEKVDHFTKSPKPGNTPLAERRRLRAPQTPDGTLLRPLSLTRHKSEGKVSLPSTVDNLDFKQTKDDLRKQADLVPLADTQRSQAQKAKEAAEYRAKILKQKRDEKQQSDELSPAYSREKESMIRSKKQKADAVERKKALDGKATTPQCIFNLSNILMGVGLLGLPYACSIAGTLGGIFAILSLGYITWRTSIMIGRTLNGDPRPLSHFDDSPWKTPLPPGSAPEARMRKPISGFPDIARDAFGEIGCLILSAVLYFELFSCIGIFLVSIVRILVTNACFFYFEACFKCVSLILLALFAESINQSTREITCTHCFLPIHRPLIWSEQL